MANGQSDESCWECGHQRIGGHLTFLGFCGWFEAHGKPRKEIPPSVVDVGCKHRIARTRESVPYQGDSDGEHAEK